MAEADGRGRRPEREREGGLPALKKEADRLYELPLGEFTAERNELAKRLRKDGDSDAADEVKSLKKPSEPAWAVNQLARNHKREVQKLLKAGERLRKAQGGGGKRDELRKAIVGEREQVARLVELARPLLGARPEAKLERVRAVLHSAAGDEATRDAIATGRLVEDKEAIGLGPLDGGGGSTSAGTARKSASERKRDKAAARRMDSARKELERAEAELGRLRDQAEEAARALENGERRAKEARERLAAAEKAAASTS